MKIVKVGDVKKRDDSANPIFRGKVFMQDIIGTSTKELRIALVSFTPGARNIFHAHTFDQILYVTEGKGIIATEKEEVIITPGTVILIPANEKHWHGATQDTSFTHLSIRAPSEKAKTRYPL